MSLRDFDGAGIQVDYHHLMLVRVHEAFRHALACRAETNNQYQPGIARFTIISSSSNCFRDTVFPCHGCC